MTRLLIAVSAACTLAAVVPYALETARGTARPQVVTWGVWAAITAIGAVDALTVGQLPATVFGFACTAECAAIAVLALRIPARDRDRPVKVPLPAGWRVRLDLICLAGAVAALLLLVVARGPAAAMAATVAADFLAFIPTVAQSWRTPGGEPWNTWALYAVGGGLTLAAADWTSFVGIAYPLYLTAGDTALVCVILARRAWLRPRRGVLPVMSDDPRRRMEGGIQRY